MEGEKLELTVTYRIWRGCLTFNHVIGESHPTTGKPWLDVLEEMGAGRREKGGEKRGGERNEVKEAKDAETKNNTFEEVTATTRGWREE